MYRSFWSPGLALGKKREKSGGRGPPFIDERSPLELAKMPQKSAATAQPLHMTHYKYILKIIKIDEKLN